LLWVTENVEVSAVPPSGEEPEEAEVRASEVVLTYFQYVGSQLSLSLRQRDYVVLLYLAAVAAVFGTAFAEKGLQISLLVLIPFLSLGAAMLAMLHHVRVGALSYARENIHDWFVKRVPDGDQLPKHRDSPALLEGFQAAPRTLRWAIQVNQVIAHVLLILVPAGAATVLIVLSAYGSVPVEPGSVPSGDQLESSLGLQIALIGGCVLCLMLSVYILGSAIRVRGRLYEMQFKFGHMPIDSGWTPAGRTPGMPPSKAAEGDPDPDGEPPAEGGPPTS
jgi:hypothetical protein